MSSLEQFASTGAGTEWVLELPATDGEPWLLHPIGGADRLKMELMQFVLMQVTDRPPSYLFSFRALGRSTYARGQRTYHSPRTIVFQVDYDSLQPGQKLLKGVEVLNYSNERNKCPKR